MTKVAIMQPTYLPWLGYFALIDAVDTFVFLDSVQFDRRSWQQRNRIIGANASMWLTVPVQSKGNYTKDIANILIDPSAKFQHKHVRSIQMAYGKAPYFDNYGKAVCDTLCKQHTHLADFTIDLISEISNMLGIKTHFQRSSKLSASGDKADLLAGICDELNADQYISPTGSASYLEQSDAFTNRGVKVLYNEYNHPQYRQLGDTFEPYMSVIDLLFNEGPASLKIIRSGMSLCAAEIYKKRLEIENTTT